MIYFVTGATGFIGKRLVAKLLEKPAATVYFLTRDNSPERLAALHAYWGVNKSRATPIVGDLLQPCLGVSKAEIKKLKGKVDHFFHLAAVYDLGASADAQMAANVERYAQHRRTGPCPGGRLLSPRQFDSCRRPV